MARLKVSHQKEVEKLQKQHQLKVSQLEELLAHIQQKVQQQGNNGAGESSSKHCRSKTMLIV